MNLLKYGILAFAWKDWGIQFKYLSEESQSQAGIWTELFICKSGTLQLCDDVFDDSEQ